MEAYITRLERFLEKPIEQYPKSWGNTPADEKLGQAYDVAMKTRPVPSVELKKKYGSLYGALLHAIKVRPDVDTALSRLGSLLDRRRPERARRFGTNREQP